MTKQQNRNITSYLTRSLIFSVLTLTILTHSYGSISKTDSLLQEWKKIKDDTLTLQKATILFEIGKSLRYQHPDSAQAYYEQAIETARRQGFTDIIASAKSGIGGVHYVKGEYEFALEAFMEALNLWEETGNQLGIAKGLGNIGLIQNMQEHYDEAISNHKKSLNTAKTTNDSAMMARNYLNLSVNYIGKNEPEIALRHLNTALDINNKLDIDPCQVINLMGQAHLKQKDFEKAAARFEQVIAAKDSTTMWEISYAHTGAAVAYRNQGATVKSTIHALDALDIAKEMNAKWDLQRITKLLAENYASEEQWQRAYHYLSLHKKYSDSVFNEKKENQINYLRLKRKEMENKTLERENKLKALQLTKRNHQMLAIAGVIIGLLVVAFLLYRNNALKSKHNRQLMKKNEAIAAKNKQLNDLNTTKDILFRVMAHDLKNPMSLVISYTEMMEEDFEEFDKEELLDFIRKLNQASGEGLQLLENLMDWARSQTGAITVQPEKLDIYEIVSENISLVSYNAESKGIRITNEVEDNTMVWGDKNMTSAILRNLLSNAVKFTSREGEIKVTSEPQQDRKIQISVHDNGMGISREHIHKLFDLNYKFSQEGTNKEKGTGLGLIICKDFVEKQGGTLTVDSQEGRGSVFRFTIPTA